jgi:hypothetical protein
MKTSSFSLFGGNLDDLRSAKKEWSGRLLNTSRAKGSRSFYGASSAAPGQNVVGIGIGEQLVGGKRTGLNAVKFFVRVKYAKHQLSKKSLLPKTIGGLPVDVEESGLFRRFVNVSAGSGTNPAVTGSAKAFDAQMPDPKARIRPAQPGCSIGFQDLGDPLVMAGTFGALVKDAAGIYILSNNHVLADEDRLSSGAAIFQPGLLDGGDTNSDQFASLARAIPLQAGAGNTMDAAIAQVANPNSVSKDLLYIGPPAGTADAAVDMIVHKFGRTTGYTVGQVTSIDTDVTVAYDTANFTFMGQIIIAGTDDNSFSAPGDSGSLILERAGNNAIGLLLGGSDSLSIASHIGGVLQALNVTLS